ncbi:MAG: hypothetical protein FVQ81_05500, partial [Candidatus Glassbacteria bacterium]|nr:hypothetical protein [Candidatus Glassbacteria bacterium]
MRGIKKIVLVLLLGLSAAAQAQYIGTSRPLGAQEMLDSLSARLDTARFSADSLRLDSLEAASATEDTDLHTRIDSVRDNPSGGGSGGGVVW